MLTAIYKSNDLIPPMPEIAVTDLSGEVRELEFEAGASLMEVLRDAGYDQILAICGGCCSCATCHVHIQEDSMRALPEIEEDEQMLVELADNYHPALSRLSCQIELTDQHDGLAITIIETD